MFVEGIGVYTDQFLHVSILLQISHSDKQDRVINCIQSKRVSVTSPLYIPFRLNIVQHILNDKTVTHVVQTPTPHGHNNTVLYYYSITCEYLCKYCTPHIQHLYF